MARSAQVNEGFAVGTAFDRLPQDALKEGRVTVGTDSGTADAYVITSAYPRLSYTPLMEVVFLPGNSCTGASTINLDGIGPKPIKRMDGEDPNRVISRLVCRVSFALPRRCSASQAARQMMQHMQRQAPAAADSARGGHHNQRCRHRSDCFNQLLPTAPQEAAARVPHRQKQCRRGREECGRRWEQPSATSASSAATSASAAENSANAAATSASAAAASVGAASTNQCRRGREECGRRCGNSCCRQRLFGCHQCLFRYHRANAAANSANAAANSAQEAATRAAGTIFHQ